MYYFTEISTLERNKSDVNEGNYIDILYIVPTDINKYLDDIVRAAVGQMRSNSFRNQYSTNLTNRWLTLAIYYSSYYRHNDLFNNYS